MSRRLGSALTTAGTGAATGAALGSVIPGVGNVVGGAVGGGIGLLAGIFGGGGPAPDSDARARVRALTKSLTVPGPRDPFETAGYTGRLGAVLDGLRDDGQGDAGRALALGLAPGMALSSGAGERSRALAGATRAAAGDAEAEVEGAERFRQGALLRALGLEVGVDDREEAERGRWLGSLSDLAKVGAGIYLNRKGGSVPNESADDLLRRELGMS